MIYKHIFCFIFIIKSLYVSTYGQPELNFFRSDYVYLNCANSFYKVHTKAKTWWNAKEKCDLEGAKLFYPDNNIELDEVICHINKTNPNIDLIHMGISATQTKGVFLTVDGVPIRDVFSNWMAGEPNDATAEDDCAVMNKLGIYQDSKCNTWLPYICKKTMQSFREWNAECKSPFLDYKFNKEMNKCYKFHTQPKSWRDAEKICEAEQAYLAIPNSQQEADHLSKITNDNPKNYEGYYLSGAVHLGYRFDETIEDWVTLKGETLEQAGYSVWNYYQPDGGEKEYCGGMFYNGEFNDISCETQNCYFICERDIDEIGGKTGKN